MIGLHEPRFTDDDERLVLEALRTSWVSSGGPLVEKFEEMFADFVVIVPTYIDMRPDHLWKNMQGSWKLRHNVAGTGADD